MAKLKSAGIYEFFWNSLSRLHVKRIDFANKTERDAHDRLVQLSKEAESSITRLETAKIQTQVQAASKRLNASLREMDQLVAGLYGLSKQQVEELAFAQL